MDWKVGAALVVVGVLLLTGIFSTGYSLPSVDTSGITGFFAAGTANSAKTVGVDAVFDIMGFSVATKADYIEVVLVDPSADVAVGGTLIDLSSRSTAKLALKGWDGKITANGTLSLDGTADEIVIDGIKLTSADKASKLSINGMGFADLKVRGVSISKLAFPSISGYIYIDGGKTTVRAEGDPVEFGSFNGDITTDTSLRLSGTAGTLSVAGKSTVSVR